MELVGLAVNKKRRGGTSDPVLLGRATEDVTVDIDLGREGCANKISRRQVSFSRSTFQLVRHAIIKMERGGSFSLKNLGKRAILMNGKDVAPGESVSLTCGCLIEVCSCFSFSTMGTVIGFHLLCCGISSEFLNIARIVNIIKSNTPSDG
ncbi:hypothetical protein CK203_086399 [Vitis vinifera]|uniref:FHA domain-containing protein n=1 Tax=Vitis vinifera TaxID=29760 RepID=A0A438ERM1_VITVI|nr:hypothetical protein CK203_086399 [Vitis vinifera]